MNDSVIPPVGDSLSKLFTSSQALPGLQQGELPREQRRRAIQNALIKHGVLTSAQLTRYFGADSVDLADLHSKQPDPIQPVHGRDLRVSVRFMALNAAALKRKPTLLAHDCATAEGQLLLGLPLEHWEIPLRGDGGESTPDAVYRAPEDGKTVAVDYDLGTYAHSKMVRKVGQFFDAYDGVLWLVTNELRATRLRAKVLSDPYLRERAKPFGTLVVRWWQGCPVIGRPARS